MGDDLLHHTTPNDMVSEDFYSFGFDYSSSLSSSLACSFSSTASDPLSEPISSPSTSSSSHSFFSPSSSSSSPASSEFNSPVDESPLLYDSSRETTPISATIATNDTDSDMDADPEVLNNGAQVNHPIFYPLPIFQDLQDRDFEDIEDVEEGALPLFFPFAVFPLCFEHLPFLSFPQISKSINSTSWHLLSLLGPITTPLGA